MSQIGDYRFAIAMAIGGVSVNSNHLKRIYALKKIFFEKKKKKKKKKNFFFFA